MSKRQKPTAPRIASKAEAEQVMHRLAQITRDKADIDTQMNREIDAIKAKAKETGQPLTQEEKALGEQLAAYAIYHKSQRFSGSKTIVGNHGKYGFRKVSSLKPLPKLKIGDILEKLKELGFTDGIRTKEEVNKEVLREWPEAKLESVGARVVSSDDFFYEVDVASLTD